VLHFTFAQKGDKNSVSFASVSIGGAATALNLVMQPNIEGQVEGIPSSVARGPPYVHLTRIFPLRRTHAGPLSPEDELYAET
jgi:hypothetical protein